MSFVIFLLSFGPLICLQELFIYEGNMHYKYFFSASELVILFSFHA